MRIKIVDRYIFSQLLGPYCFGFFMFVTVIAIDPLIYSLQNIVNDGVSPYAILRWFLNRLPQDMIFTFPMSMLLTTLLVFGRMSKDSETIALKAGGLNFFRLLVPVLVFAIMITAFSFYFNEKVVPHSNKRANEIRRKEILKLVEPEATENTLMKGSDGSHVYARKVYEARGTMESILLEYYEHGVLTRRVSATLGKWNGTCWDLEGVVDQKYVGGVMTSSQAIPVLQVAGLRETPKDFARQTKKANEMSYKELKERIDMFERTRFDDTTEMRVELAVKTSLPFATIFFALIGASFGLTSYRSGAFIGFGVSIVIIFVYYTIMSISVALGKAGTLPPMLAAWLQNIVFAGGGFFLVARVNT
jgi:lipopolysaccharide export system permease protein